MLVRPLLALAIAVAPISLPAAHAQPGGCPPGLAKKSPACVPPGQAKKQGYVDRDRDRDRYHRDRDDDDDRSRWLTRGDRVIGPDGRVYTVGDRLPGGPGPKLFLPLVVGLRPGGPGPKLFLTVLWRWWVVVGWWVVIGWWVLQRTENKSRASRGNQRNNPSGLSESST